MNYANRCGHHVSRDVLIQLFDIKISVSDAAVAINDSFRRLLNLTATSDADMTADEQKLAEAVFMLPTNYDDIDSEDEDR